MPSFEASEILVLMNKLQFFFHVQEDSSKLVWMSQLITKNSVKFMNHCQSSNSSIFCLAKFLNLTLQYITHYFSTDSNESRDPLGSHWRVLEIFLSLTNWRKNVEVSRADAVLGFIFGILVEKGHTSTYRFFTISQNNILSPKQAILSG